MNYDEMEAEARHEAVAASAEDKNGWQPIETAPKDGTSIILYAGYRIVGEARWIGEGASEGWWWAGEGPGDYHADKIGSLPTHWTPLPAPPEIGDK